MKRAPKLDPNSRCCWVCGKPGGDGFTTMLRLLGYENVVNPSHAHQRCIRRLQIKQQKAREIRRAS